MKIKNIKVMAGRTFNHPHESYSNFKPGLTIEADLEEGEDAAKAIKELQAKAESLVEDHKNNMLQSIEEIREIRELDREAQSLEETLKRGQERLVEIRKRRGDQPLLPLETNKDEALF